MAFMNQEMKNNLAPNIKKVLKKFGVSGTISVRNHLALVVTLSKGNLDIIGNWFDTVKNDPRYNNPAKPDSMSVNTYRIESGYTGKVKEFLLELKNAMMTGNHDNRDIQADFFDVGWYIDINVGKWNKPYILEN